jgi:hypothetical protein
LTIAVLDISETGVRLTVGGPVPRGEEVDMQMTGPGLIRSLRRSGTVVWSVPLQDGSRAIGVAFHKPLSYADFQRLARV